MFSAWSIAHSVTLGIAAFFESRFSIHCTAQQSPCLANRPDLVSYPLYEFVLFSAFVIDLLFTETQCIESYVTIYDIDNWHVMECHEEWMSIRERCWECRSYCLPVCLCLCLSACLSLSLSLSLPLHRCISTFLCVLHSTRRFHWHSKFLSCSCVWRAGIGLLLSFKFSFCHLNTKIRNNFIKFQR
jgi:hypothetical protein